MRWSSIAIERNRTYPWHYSTYWTEVHTLCMTFLVSVECWRSPVYLIQSWWDSNHMDNFSMPRASGASCCHCWFTICVQVVCAGSTYGTYRMCRGHVWICMLCPWVFFYHFWKFLENIQSYCSSCLDFFFSFLEKSGCVVTMCTTLWLPARKQADLKAACCYFLFLFVTFFVFNQNSYI